MWEWSNTHWERAGKQYCRMKSSRAWLCSNYFLKYLACFQSTGLVSKQEFHEPVFKVKTCTWMIVYGEFKPGQKFKLMSWLIKQTFFITRRKRNGPSLMTCVCLSPLIYHCIHTWHTHTCKQMGNQPGSSRSEAHYPCLHARCLRDVVVLSLKCRKITPIRFHIIECTMLDICHTS